MCVHAAEHAVQATDAQPPVDLPLSDPCRQQLGTGHDPVLGFGKRGDYFIDAT